MFDSTTSLTDRLTDSLDLVIDFATLGEYGLEPVGPNPQTRQACHGDRRTGRPAVPKRRDRGPKPTVSAQSDLWSQMTRRPFAVPPQTPAPRVSRTNPRARR
jgi:hypothetical protein